VQEELPEEEMAEQNSDVINDTPRNKPSVNVDVFGKIVASGQQVPLRPKSAKEFQAQGYQRVHEAEHILRDTKAFETRFEELMDIAVPKPKKEKKAGGGGKKKKK